MWWVRDERGVSAVGLIAGVLVAAALIAIPVVLVARSHQERTREAVGALDGAEGVAAHANLTLAVRAATTYAAEHGGFQGFDPTTAAAIDPGIRWNAAPTAIPGQVSVRGAGPASVVLVTTGAGGPVCAAILGATVVEGRTDATQPGSCRP